MKKNILIIALIIIVIMLSYLLITKYNKDSESKLGDFSKVIDLNESKNSDEDNTNKDEEEKTTNSTDTKDDTNENTNKNQNSQSNQSSNNVSYSENDVIDYFSDIENEVNNESKLDTFKTKFKDYFTNTVDFIFYDKEIKGHKFKDLTATAKLKVIASAIKIDSKIDEKVPNYKDTLGDKYKGIKDKLVTKYLDLTVSICSNHEQGCDKAKEIFGEIKEKGKITLSYIKNVLSKGKNKLKDYYEIYRDS